MHYTGSAGLPLFTSIGKYRATLDNIRSLVQVQNK